MNKEQAARYLNVSVRTLQRYTSANLIAAKYQPTPQGHVAVDYDPAELDRFKAELAKRVTTYVKPSVIGDTPAVTPDGGAAAETALAPVQPNYVEHLAAALDALKTALRPATPAVPLSAKLVLTLNESAMLSGLSRRILLAAIRGGTLKAKVMGKGWKVKRADLEGFVKRL